MGDRPQGAGASERMVVVSVTRTDRAGGQCRGAFRGNAELEQKPAGVDFHGAYSGAAGATRAQPRMLTRDDAAKSSVGTGHKRSLTSGAACTLGGRGHCCARCRQTTQRGQFSSGSSHRSSQFSSYQIGVLIHHFSLEVDPCWIRAKPLRLVMLTRLRLSDVARIPPLC